MRSRGRELLENGEQYQNKKMKSIAPEEQEQEEGSKSESETRFVDLDPDTLRNVLQRVDLYAVGRAMCVNKMWRTVARDERLLAWNFSTFHGILGAAHLGELVFKREQEEPETGFGDLKWHVLLNVFKRVDVVTLGRAACVNKQWDKVAWANEIWEPIVERMWASNGKIQRFRATMHYINSLKHPRYVLARRAWFSDEDIRDYITPPPDFYSIDFSTKIRHWVSDD